MGFLLIPYLAVIPILISYQLAKLTCYPKNTLHGKVQREMLWAAFLRAMCMVDSEVGIEEFTKNLMRISRELLIKNCMHFC
jgi:hypothetical protein